MFKRFVTARMPRRAVVVLATLVSLTLVSGIAWAYWTSNGSGIATASTGTLNPPTQVTASFASGAVSVGWSASTGSPAPQGYYVTRTNTSTQVTANACGSSSTQLLTAVSCTDGSVAAGTYTYAVVAVLASWTATSASSSSVVVPTLVGTTTALTSSPNPSMVGQKVTYTATVAQQSGTKKPTGTVTFTDAGASVCANVTVSAGKATCAVTYASPGSHSIVATYTPTGSFGASTSPTLTQTVNKASTTTALTSSPKAPVAGQSVTLTAAVAVTSPGSGTPTGTVTFTDAATTVCTQTLSSGSATCTVPFTTASSHSLVATYSGDDSFSGSSGSLTQTVGDASTTTTLTPATASAVIGQTVTFTATVAVLSPGSGTATGSVTFKEGTTAICSAVTLSGGVATCQAAFSTVASHKVTATYSGDANDSGSTSGTSTVTVSKASTTTTVTSSANPSVVGQQVTYTATVTMTAPGAGTPTGTVTFKDGATTICSLVEMGGGQATCAPAAYTSTGSHTITAVYSGDSNDITSTSATLTQTVGQAATSTAVTSSTNPSTVGAQVTYTATVAVSAPGAGTLSGTVTFKDGATVICSAVMLSSSVASCQNSPSTSGAHSITAIFTSGSSTIAGSTSAVLTQTVSSFSQGGVSGGNGDTVLTASSFNWQVASPNQFCTTVQPTTSSATPVAWSLQLDTTQLPFNGSTPVNIQGAAVSQQPDANGIMYLGGTGSGTGTFDATSNNKLIQAGQYANVSFCVYTGNPPAIVAQGSGTYTYSTVLGSGASQYYACAVTTVVGHFPTFYVGFQVSVDWQAVLNVAVSAGQITSSQRTSLLAKTLSAWNGGGGSWNVSQSGYVYTASGASAYNNSGITNGQTITINSCTS